ncbi:DUF6480 family protein [Streptomyces sp. NPDC007172]|uniref:DUF6480 family protein n=1 Tax=unclassified Streptomyces TaxID=2593676 RepID=UPI003678DCE4
MTDPLVPPGRTSTGKTPPGETPPAEGSIAEAHEERPDGGLWEHPRFWLWLIAAGAVLIAAFFIARLVSL